MSTAVSHGIRVDVDATYLSKQSRVAQNQFVFGYTVTITNQTRTPVQLRGRHWIITHGSGRVEEVVGEGVVGEKPVLLPGTSYRYTSGCVLDTPWGMMNGTYRMIRDDGATMEVEIAPFLLATPRMDATFGAASARN